jgi:hypothetical protein
VVRVLTSVRSFSDAGLRAVQAGIGELAEDIGADREVTDGYPVHDLAAGGNWLVSDPGRERLSILLGDRLDFHFGM